MVIGIGTPEGSTWGVREAGATPYIISKGVNCNAFLNLMNYIYLMKMIKNIENKLKQENYGPQY